jgi:hypothetical protein
MGALIVYALPIAPGQTGRAGSFGAEMTPELREAYEELNRRAGLRRHMEWVQPSPMGDLLLVLMESDTPEKIGRPFVDSPYDRWWTERVRQIHGFDPAAPDFVPAFPTLTWNWADDETAPDAP